MPLKRKIRIVFDVLVLIIVAVVMVMAVRYAVIRMANTHVPDLDTDVWYELAPEGIVSANGEPVTSRLRIGEESDKIIVLFYGGGISINEFTADHPYTTTNFFYDNGFYAPDISGMIPDLCDAGLGSMKEENPFRDWSVVIIPYTTGDYHIGTADYSYTDREGNEQVLYHHGYTNYRALMDEAVKYFSGDVSELLIAGCSAGGFGAAMLAEEIIEDYFPKAEHVTLCVDSSFQHYDGWAEVARDVWGAPEELVDVMSSDNLLVDFFTNNHEIYGNRITYLYIGSVRDGSLTKYQSFLNGSRFSANDRQGQFFAEELKSMLLSLKEEIPGLGVYLFTLPFSLMPNQLRLTQHTILIGDTAFWRLTEQTSVLDWLMNAVSGVVKDCGLYLLR